MRIHHLSHRGPHHPGVIAEVEEHQNRDRQDELLAEQRACARGSAGQPVEPEHEDRQQKCGRREFRHRCRQHRNEGNRPVHEASLGDARQHPEHERDEDRQAENPQRQYAGVQQARKDDLHHRPVELDRGAEIPRQRASYPGDIPFQERFIVSVLFEPCLPLFARRVGADGLDHHPVLVELEENIKDERRNQHDENHHSQPSSDEWQHSAYHSLRTPRRLSGGSPFDLDFGSPLWLDHSLCGRARARNDLLGLAASTGNIPPPCTSLRFPAMTAPTAGSSTGRARSVSLISPGQGAAPFSPGRGGP